MAYPPAGRVLGLGIRQLLTPPTYLLIWDTSSGSGFSSGNMSALLLVHGVITVRISRRWTCQLRWAKLALHTCCGLTPCRVEDEEQDHLWVGAIIPWRLCTESEWNASECFRDAQSQEAAMWAKDFGWVPILASPSCLWPILWFMVPPTLLRRRLSTRGALAASYNSHGGLGGISIQHPSELGRIIRTGEHICGSVAQLGPFPG